MKRFLKRGLKAAWRATEVVRRPIHRRIDAYLRRVLWPVYRASDEMEFALHHVVRELIRLQDQIEQLQATVEQLREAQTPLAVVRAEGERRAG